MGNTKAVKSKKPKLSKDGNVFSSVEQLGGTKRENDVSMLRRQIGEVRNMCGTILPRFESVLHDRLAKSDAIIELLLSEVKDLRAIVSLKKGGSRGKGETGKSAELEVPFFDYVFSEEVSQVVLERCVVEHMTDLITMSGEGVQQTSIDSSLTDTTRTTRNAFTVVARRAAASIRVLMFAVNLKKGEDRSMYKTELGRQFSEFREGIVLTALNAAKNNNFNMFRQSTKSTTDKHVQQKHVDMKTTKPNLPKWLTKDFVTYEDISLARIKLEETSNKNAELKPAQASSKDTRSDEDKKLGAAAAYLLYSRFTKVLSSARTTSKISFFEEVGYLFVDWRALGASADQGTLKLSWRNPHMSVKYENIDSVPETSQQYNSDKTGGSEDESMATINRRNKQVLQQLMADCEDMVIRVEHEVCIRKHAKTSGEKGASSGTAKVENSSPDSASESIRSQDSGVTAEFDKREYMVRDINLIDIGCRLVSSYTSQSQYASSAPFLSSSRNALKCVYAVSLFLRRLLDKVIISLGKNGFNERKLMEDINVNGINLKSLLPTPSSQKSGVHTKTVHMFQHVFNARCNVQPPRQNSGPGSANQDDNRTNLQSGSRAIRNPRIITIN